MISRCSRSSPSLSSNCVEYDTELHLIADVNRCERISAINQNDTKLFMRYLSRILLFLIALTCPVTFAVAAAGSVLLLRISKQMGGGKLAVAMGWIIAHIVLRAALVLSTTLQAHLNKSLPFSDFMFFVISTWAIWMFAMAAASRYQVSLTAAQQAARWGVVNSGQLIGAERI